MNQIEAHCVKNNVTIILSANSTSPIIFIINCPPFSFIFGQFVKFCLYLFIFQIYNLPLFLFFLCHACALSVWNIKISWEQLISKRQFSCESQQAIYNNPRDICLFRKSVFRMGAEHKGWVTGLVGNKIRIIK